ncbi:EcKinase, DUF1679, and/or APH domain containing protein [Asbolus verrucosus]|uniref:EcKinase, DUF1679, and/or APH domain containing protein n=1 Tax=Asbolus verrucosus TaxID=1661398 RepID=A0A482VD18_ASBVE|nr:EcKinase, DUF1679, and/or APH domain containing protein [Asbolus verrucosus]
MLSVDVIVKTPERIEKINAVAKMLPPNELMQEMFNCQVTFRNEIGFYKTMVPTLQHFQREHGVTEVIDFSPKYYGSRSNLNGSTKIDTNAVLLLENLKVQNFVNFERTEGFDLEVSKLIIRDLAHLHAVPLALKLQKPEVFETAIMQFLSSLVLQEEVLKDLKEKYDKIINNVDDLKPYLERLKKVSLDVYPPGPPREPFATVSHNDCWVNNTMIQIKDGKPFKSKLVDYQLCDYGSPAKDVLFFLFSSVQNHILEKHYDDLIEFYHKTFTSTLVELHCETTEFSLEAFKKELDYEAKHTQFVHTVLMLFPIFAPRGTVTDIVELKPTDIGNSEPTGLHKQKLLFVVKEFARRNWI